MQQFFERAEQIVRDRDHGSRWLVREAVLLLRSLAMEQSANPQQQVETLFAVGRRLACARPAMSALPSAVSRVLCSTHGPETDVAVIAQKATDFLEAYDAAIKQIVEHARPVLHGNVLTCSLSHTLVEALEACRERVEQVYVLEGRPRYEGRTMAQQLALANIQVTLLTDAQAAIFLPQCQCVVVGADSLLADGTVLNKAGTALLAWAAQGYQVPLYVLCETLKISSRRWSDDLAQFAESAHLLEEKEASEVWDQPPIGVTVRNYYFDATPAKLVRAWLTERGSLTVPEIASIAHETQHAIHMLEQR
ncbi:translation initiation factor eIF-2B [Ktedonobacter robiniae]|uniref:Translation initiation factor eIF2B subunit beta n=1 Tax=Ktedonobacter robiniae TaxID=2778365 RepID=A0ABQ3UIV5_9CHLR|nr:hypothetical protein [Ktedonobacter robiniae]GHO52659.1 ribose 1,5-bisphosphate isomerase [Ktedonobacter robiniae]